MLPGDDPDRRGRPQDREAGERAGVAFGHGAAAVLVGKGDDLAAELLGVASLQDDFVDHYRASDSRFDYALEERWVRDEGYLQIVPRAIDGRLAEAGIAAAAVDRFILQGPARFATGRGQVGRAARRGHPGRFARRLRQHRRRAPVAAARRGARDVRRPVRSCCWRVSARVATRCCCARPVVRPPTVAGRHGALADGVADREYLRFLANCGLVDIDWGMRAERDNRTAQTVAWRKHRDVTGFVGRPLHAVRHGAVPRARACVNPACRAFDTQVTASAVRHDRHGQDLHRGLARGHAQSAARVRQRRARWRWQRLHRICGHAGRASSPSARPCASCSASRTPTRCAGSAAISGKPRR